MAARGRARDLDRVALRTAPPARAAPPRRRDVSADRRARGRLEPRRADLGQQRHELLRPDPAGELPPTAELARPRDARRPCGLPRAADSGHTAGGLADG